MKYKTLFNTILEHIRDAIQSKEFLDKYKEPKRFVRKRLLSMYQVILYLLYSNRASMAINIGNIRDDMFDLDFPVISRQAVSKARQFIKPELFEELFRITVTDYYAETQEYKTWNGYHLFAIDGSSIHMTNNKSVIEEFGESTDPRYERHHYMGLGSCLYDISQDMIVDASLSHCRTGERELAINHLNRLKKQPFSKNALIIMDRGYYSHELYNYMVDSGFKCLMRIKKDYTSLTSHDSDDIIIDHKKLHEQIRVIKVLLSSGEMEYLATNVMDSTITPEMFKELYHNRWKIEVKYYELKEHWELEKFNGATSRAVRQEFFIHLMKANLASILKQDVDLEIQVQATSSVEISEEAEESEKSKYQACRAFIIGRLSRLLPRYINLERVKTAYEQLYEEAKRVKSQIRPGRHAKRRKPTNQKTNCKNRKTTT